MQKEEDRVKIWQDYELNVDKLLSEINTLKNKLKTQRVKDFMNYTNGSSFLRCMEGMYALAAKREMNDDVKKAAFSLYAEMRNVYNTFDYAKSFFIPGNYSISYNARLLYNATCDLLGRPADCDLEIIFKK